MSSEVGGTAASAGGGEGYGVLMISDALGATEVIALEKVRPSRQRLGSILRYLSSCWNALNHLRHLPIRESQSRPLTARLCCSRGCPGGGGGKAVCTVFS